MDLKILDYNLPLDKIGYFPRKRGFSKLLVCFKKTGDFVEDKFYNIDKFLEENSLLILNDTKVYKARVYFNFNDGKRGEILILRYNENEMLCLGKPAKKILKEKEIYFPSKIKSEDIKKERDNIFFIRINSSVENLIKIGGVPPLPPYIKRDSQKEDNEWYQTVYAKKVGSIAAPTAGLHFTEEILKKLKKKGIKIFYLTLHIGTGTFKPIRTKNIEDHKMEEEYFEISKNLAYEIENAKSERRKITAVGTTTVRALESAYIIGGGKICPINSKTDLFIYPNFEFKVVDGIITNFHQPRSTPLCLVCALAGLENIKKWYKEAINLDFKFLSYGDSMLIL